MLVAPLNMEFQPSIEPIVVVFDIQSRGYGKAVNVNIADCEGEVLHKVTTKYKTRLQFTSRLAGALLDISQADPEHNDGWVRMDQMVPRGANPKHSNVDRAILKNHLMNVSEDFGGLLQFRNISKASEIRATRPFAVAYARRSKYFA